MNEPRPIREPVAELLAKHELANVIELFFDGACEPKNPGGVATCGWLIQSQQRGLIASGSREVARGDGATNNVAEWTALGLGLRFLLDNPEIASGNVLQIHGDSKLVIEQLNHTWRCNNERLQRLRARCEEIISQLPCVTWRATWIPREENEEADALSRRAYETATGKTFPTYTHR
jgi:ribonuclease HI